MEAVGSNADERRVVLKPSLRPVATKDISEADTELIGHNQAGARDQQHFCHRLNGPSARRTARIVRISGDQVWTSGGG